MTTQPNAFVQHVENCRICDRWDWCEEGAELLRETLFQSVERREAAERCGQIGETE